MVCVVCLTQTQAAINTPTLSPSEWCWTCPAPSSCTCAQTLSTKQKRVKRKRSYLDTSCSAFQTNTFVSFFTPCPSSGTSTFIPPLATSYFIFSSRIEPPPYDMRIACKTAESCSVDNKAKTKEHCCTKKEREKITTRKAERKKRAQISTPEWYCRHTRTYCYCRKFASGFAGAAS